MNYRVTHYAVRYGDVQERTMYTGTSKVVAYLVLWFVFLVFATSLDMVDLGTYSQEAS